MTSPRARALRAAERVLSIVGRGVALGACIALRVHAQPPVREIGHEVLTSVTRVRFPSKAFHANHDVYIWAPDVASSAADRYPVMIFLDAEESGQFRSALANIQFMIDRNQIPPMIVVGVPYLVNRQHELTPVASEATAKNFPAAGGADVTLQFISDEVLPWVDAHYPTLPTRLLAGHSLGGLFALYAMTARPDVFRIVLAMSPLVEWNEGAFSSQVVARLVADTGRVRTLILSSGGLEPSIDGPVTAFAARLRAALDSTPGNRLRFTRRQYPRDIHDMTPLTGLVDGLRLIYDPIVVPVDSVLTVFTDRHTEDTASILAAVRDLESHYAASAALLGVVAPFPEDALDGLGSYSLQVKHPELAVQLFRENSTHYPRSSNAHESLGEGLAAVGDTTAAVAELRHAIAITRAELRTPQPILRAVREKGVASAAAAQLHAMHRDSPQSGE